MQKQKSLYYVRSTSCILLVSSGTLFVTGSSFSVFVPQNQARVGYLSWNALRAVSRQSGCATSHGYAVTTDSIRLEEILDQAFKRSFQRLGWWLLVCICIAIEPNGRLYLHISNHMLVRTNHRPYADIILTLGVTKESRILLVARNWHKYGISSETEIENRCGIRKVCLRYSFRNVCQSVHVGNRPPVPQASTARDCQMLKWILPHQGEQSEVLPLPDVHGHPPRHHTRCFCPIPEHQIRCQRLNAARGNTSTSRIYFTDAKKIVFASCCVQQTKSTSKYDVGCWNVPVPTL